MSPEPTCGARRPGWERPGPGRHRLPCVREQHEGDHRNALDETWPPTCQECGSTAGALESLTVSEPDGTMYDGHLCAGCRDDACDPPSHRNQLSRWLDTGSGPGVMIPVRAVHPQAAYRAWLEHTTACDRCRAGLECETVRPLWAAYQRDRRS